MFSKSCGKKKYGLCAIITIGALAAVGAMTIKNCGKNAMTKMLKKAKKLFEEAKDTMCPMDSEN